MSVVVVGAGIVGASVAYHLAVLGVPVTLVDRGEPGAGVTGGSFGWIGAGDGDWPGGAADLRRAVLVDHRRLADSVAGAGVRWSGSLAWPDARPGEDGRWVGRAEIALLEPHLDPPERAVYRATDAGVDPGGMTRALVRAAGELGARVVTGVVATSLRMVRGRVDGLVTLTGVHAADTVVLAAGTGVPALAAPLGVRLPVAASPAFLVRVAAPVGLVRTVVATPHLEVREVRDGELVMTAPLGADRSPAALERLAQGALDRLRAMVRSDGPFRLLGWGVGARPMPADGPLVGFLAPDRSAYVAVMHSGISLAPTVGRLVAQEIAGGQDVPELARCRPVRR